MTVILKKMEQGSQEWLKARVGCITMSNAKSLLTGGKGMTRLNYIMDVASEVISGINASRPKTWDMQRGNILEPYAIEAYELMTGVKVERVGLGYLDQEKRIAASPDGLTQRKGVEVKARIPKVHLRTIVDGTVPKDSMAQIQGNMWVFNLEEWDYVSFCPNFPVQPIFISTVRRDEEMIKKIKDASLAAVTEVDKYIEIAKAGIISADLLNICTAAQNHVDEYFNVEPEIE